MKRLVLPILGIALGSLAFTSSAYAQSFEVAESGPKPSVVLSKPEVVADALKKFDKKKPEIEQSLFKELGRANGVGSGITLYPVALRFGKTEFRFVSADAFEIQVTKNLISFSLTKPADTSAKPGGEIVFDIRVRGTLHQPTKETPQVAVTDATISTANVAVRKSDSSSAETNFERVMEAFEKMDPERNVLRSAFDRYLRMEFNDQLNKGLRPINKKISELVKKGMNPTCSVEKENLRVTLSGG